MTRLAVLLLLLGLAGPAHAMDQIIPMTVQTVGGFGAGLPVPPPNRDGVCQLPPLPKPQDGSYIHCVVPVPVGAVAIVGWTGWWRMLMGTAATNYMSIKFWHDGGTPHLLQDTYLPAPQLGGQITQSGYPAGSGHHAVPGDLVFGEFICVSTVCTGAVTFNFLVPAAE